MSVRGPMSRAQRWLIAASTISVIVGAATGILLPLPFAVAADILLWSAMVFVMAAAEPWRDA